MILNFSIRGITLLDYAVYGGHQDVVDYLVARGGRLDSYILSMRRILDSDEGKDVIFTFEEPGPDGQSNTRVLMAHLIVLYCRMPSLLFNELLPHAEGLHTQKGAVLEAKVMTPS